MDKKTKTSEEILVEAIIESKPSAATLKVVATTKRLYDNLHGGKTKKCVTLSVKLFAAKYLPELTPIQVFDLDGFVHNMIETTLSYFIEDGLIKEE